MRRKDNDLLPAALTPAPADPWALPDTITIPESIRCLPTAFYDREPGAREAEQLIERLDHVPTPDELQREFDQKNTIAQRNYNRLCRWRYQLLCQFDFFPDERLPREARIGAYRGALQRRAVQELRGRAVLVRQPKKESAWRALLGDLRG